MENTLENKAKFFAQYFGQEVAQYSIIEMGKLQEYKLTKACPQVLEELHAFDYLQLTPLHLISDEDAVDVAFESNSHFVRCFESYGEEFNDLILKHCQIDFLRSKGYALPFNGLSVEEQVSRGWVKLRTEI